ARIPLRQRHVVDGERGQGVVVEEGQGGRGGAAQGGVGRVGELEGQGLVGLAQRVGKEGGGDGLAGDGGVEGEGAGGGGVVAAGGGGAVGGGVIDRDCVTGRRVQADGQGRRRVVLVDAQGGGVEPHHGQQRARLQRFQQQGTPVEPAGAMGLQQAAPAEKPPPAGGGRAGGKVQQFFAKPPQSIPERHSGLLHVRLAASAQ